MKTNYQPVSLLAFLFLFFISVPSSGQGTCDISSNGGFEDYGVGAGDLGFFGSSLGWTSESQGVIEIWGSGFNGVPAYEGTDFAELNSDGPDILSQDLSTIPGSSYDWQVAHRGRDGVDGANLEMGPPGGPYTLIQALVDGTSGWGVYSGTYTVPAGQTTTRVRFVSVFDGGGCSSCANFLDAFEFLAGDTDRDGVNDCNDGCPTDPNKQASGQCGCGNADTDSDGDSVADCNDGCPTDPNKQAAGICGCGTADTDSDGDTVADCNDGCPTDPNKIAAGQCGCGNADTDSDGDTVANCLDNCTNTPNSGQDDSDCDGRGNACDVCPGGNDMVDNNHDNLPDCHYLPPYNQIIAAWKCGNNKVLIAHRTGNGGCNTLCVAYSAAQAHLNHGDYLGPCNGAACNNNGLVIPDIHLSAATTEALEVYPNPATDELNIKFPVLNTSTIISISDNMGRTLWTQKLEEGRSATRIDLSDARFANGIYYIQTVSEKQLQTQRFVISK